MVAEPPTSLAVPWTFADRGPPVRFTVNDVQVMLRAGLLPEDASTELLDGCIVIKDRSATGEDPMSHKGYNGNTALLRCADSGTKYADLYTDEVTFLLARGANVNATNRDGDMGLHLAAKSNLPPKTIRALLAAVAAVNA